MSERESGGEIPIPVPPEISVDQEDVTPMPMPEEELIKNVKKKLKEHQESEGRLEEDEKTGGDDESS